MSVCLICKERYMCDRLLYECPREEKPDGKQDELSPDEKAEWESLLNG